MWLMIASLNMALAVMLGAFGAHGLEKRATAQQLEWWATSTDYFFYHALGLLALAVLHKINSLFPIKASFISIQLGIVLFCGSLYIMGLGATKSLGMITPLGGLFMIIGWLLLAYNALKYRNM